MADKKSFSRSGKFVDVKKGEILEGELFVENGLIQGIEERSTSSDDLYLPGFVDAHSHPSHAMDLVGNISLYGGDDLEDYLEEISAFVLKHPERDFYRGSGWADTFFTNLGPDKTSLDSILPDRPIALIS